MEPESKASNLMTLTSTNEPSYTLVTAAYNEQDYIEQTIDSVLQQTLRPVVWLIVSDGSTDATDEIVRRYAAKYSFIQLLRREKDQNRGFASKVYALRAGLKHLGDLKTEFIAHLDADISLTPGYFEQVLEKFRLDPNLGIGGGWYEEKQRGAFAVAPGNNPASVPGCIQVFRRRCYEEIGGLLPIEYGGEDWYVEIMARKTGWRVQCFPELLVRHLRETGTAKNRLRYCFHQGITDFALGSHPVFELVKVAKRIFWTPFIIGATARLSGFAVAHLRRRRMVDDEFVQFLRLEQLRRLGVIGRIFARESRTSRELKKEKIVEMNPIRVCAITCDRYPEDPLVRRTAEAAASETCEYHVISSQGEGQAKEEVFRDVHIHRICIPDGNGRPIGRITAMGFGAMLFYWTAFAIKAAIKVARLHFKHKFDVVHVHNLPDFLVFAAIVPKCFGARVILHIQDVTPELMSVKASGMRRTVTVALTRIQERMSTAFADHVVTVGWPFEKPLLERGVRAEKLSSILNSADPKIFAPSKRTEPFLEEATEERPLILMYHGTCANRNGLDTAIKAFAKAHHRSAPHLVFHIRGEGEAVPYLKQLARELGVADRVVFTGYGPLEEVADFVVHGDIGIVCYPCDGFMDLVLPTKAYEYSWMRRPIIAANTSAIRSMFRPSSLKLCKAADADSFASAIEELYRDPRKRGQLVAGAWEDYQRFRWELMAERYRELLRCLAAHRPVNTSLDAADCYPKPPEGELVYTEEGPVYGEDEATPPGAVEDPVLMADSAQLR
jgi:glycosyltransferase involved in cell wall biosynthesis